MHNRRIDDEHSRKEITAVITRNIKPGHEKEYDEWLRRYMTLENKVPGYLGTTIIAPGGKSSSVRYIINRFSDTVTLDAWESSPEARKLIEEANKCSTMHYTSATGLETWFYVSDLKAIVAPPRWKMAIVAFIGAFCISCVCAIFPWPLHWTAPITHACLYEYNIGDRSYLCNNATIEQNTAKLVVSTYKTLSLNFCKSK